MSPKPLRILYLCPHDPWPLNTGARLRDYHLAKELARTAEVTFGCVTHDGKASEMPPPESGFEKTVLFSKPKSYTPMKVVKGILGPVPVTVLNFSSPEMYDGLRKLVSGGRFDSVQIEAIHFYPYLNLLRNDPSRPALVSDWHNIESEVMWRYSEFASGPRKIVARRTAALLEKVEKKLLEQTEACAVASDREREKALQLFGPHEIDVLPNGIDFEHYSDAALSAAIEKNPVEIEGPYVLFVGSMDYHANVDGVTWFMREVWPGLREKRPELKLAIVGRDPVPAIQALRSPEVIVTGTVPDVRPYYRNAAALLAPLRIGSGTRLKILEAMAAGTPVIATALGAEGIEVQHETDVLLADTPAEFITATGRLLDNPAMAKALAAKARILAAERYDWKSLGAMLMQIHARVVEKKRFTKK